eukprot:GHVN01033147.1.p1 GENE.GHVN01033147.1~~GHVN01033147.1.p1  ORF type:complete len:660 (-),score=94.42 GHVN01033147.1:1070-3049(-)
MFWQRTDPTEGPPPPQTLDNPTFQNVAPGPQFQQPERNPSGGAIVSCLMALVVVIMLISIDSASPPSPSTPHSGAPPGDPGSNEARLYPTSRLESAMSLEKAYSFLFSGRYNINSTRPLPAQLDEKQTERDTAVETGTVSVLIETWRIMIRGVRVSSLRLLMRPDFNPAKTRMVVMKGLDMADMNTFLYSPETDLTSIADLLSSDTKESSGDEVFLQKPLDHLTHCGVAGQLQMSRPRLSSLSHRGVDAAHGIAVTTGRDAWRLLDEAGPPSDRGLEKGDGGGGGGGDVEVFENVLDSSRQLDVTGGDTQRPIKDIQGDLVSVDCGISIRFIADEVDLDNLETKVMYFTLFISLKILMEWRFSAMLIHSRVNSQRLHSNLSFISLMMQCGNDITEAVFLFVAGLSSNFQVPSFTLMFLLKAFFLVCIDARLLACVWASRNRELAAEGEDALLRRARTYRLFAGVSVLLCIPVYFLMRWVPFTIVSLAHLYWVPQIFRDVWKGQRRSLPPVYIVGLSLSRLAFPLYLWGCPVTIFTGDVLDRVPSAPSPTICVSIAFLTTLQVVVMLLQRRYGSRFFVPLSWLPHVYDYHRHVTVADMKGVDSESGGAVDCVICMTDVGVSDRGRVVTPCDHMFHGECLQQWMDVKMECPACRGALPPFA